MPFGYEASLNLGSVLRAHAKCRLRCNSSRSTSFEYKGSNSRSFFGQQRPVRAQSSENGAGDSGIGDGNEPNNRQSSKRYRALPLSMFKPFGRNLPPDGKTQTEEEETCDPYERSCQTPMYVWESQCEMCNGLGQVRSRSTRSGRGRGNRQLYSGTYYTCLSCNGLGAPSTSGHHTRGPCALECRFWHVCMGYPPISRLGIGNYDSVQGMLLLPVPCGVVFAAFAGALFLLFSSESSPGNARGNHPRDSASDTDRWARG
eukprot:jgi/Botrbrau1/9053/Bobra.0376s0027.1